MKAYVSGVGDQEIGIIAAGEVLGEMSFVDGRLPSATVKAIDDTLVLSISKEKLNEKLEQDVLFSLRFYRAVTKFLSTRLRGTVTRFSDRPEVLYPDSLENNNIETEIDNNALAKSRYETLMIRLNS